MRYQNLSWICLSISLWGCGSPQNLLFDYAGETMGTSYRITYGVSDPAQNVEQATIDELLDEINGSLSPYEPNSIISRINRSNIVTESHGLDSHFEFVFIRAKEIHAATGGAFNPALGPLIRSWGFSKDEPRMLDSTEVQQLLSASDFNNFSILDTSPPMLVKDHANAELDFGGIAKGYAVDELGRLLEESGIENYLIEIGGEIRSRGQHPEGRPWRIGIEKPIEFVQAMQAVIQLNDQSMATSGNYRNFRIVDGRKIVHTINPATGYPELNNLLSVTVLQADCIDADGFATAFMVMGLDRAAEFVEEHDNLDVLFIYDGGEEQLKTYSTPGMASLLIEQSPE